MDKKNVLRNYENRQILKALLANDKMSINEIKELKEVNSEKIRDNLKQLRQNGFLDEVGSDTQKYVITEKGEEKFVEQLKERKKEVEELLENIK